MRARAICIAAALLVSASAHAQTSLVPAEAQPLLACGVAAPDWNRPRTDEGMFAPRTFVPDLGAGCPRTQLLRWRFAAPAGLERAFLTLRARYQHGFVAYLDGVEVARRRLEPTATLDALASDVHGPEWERIVLPQRGVTAGDHVLAVEAHPRTAGREPSFDVELTATDGVTGVNGPYLLEVTTRSARIAFESDVPTTAQLRWASALAGKTGELVASSAGDAPARRHVFTIDGLHAATSYEYALTARAPEHQGAYASEVARFHTMPEKGRPLRFVIYGDVRSGHVVHAELAAAILAEEPDLAIMTGDLVDMGSDEADWTRYFEIAGKLLAGVPVYPSPGNHEYARGGRGAERFRGLFITGPPGTPAWRSFDVAGVHFVALDSNHFRNGDQLTWLKQDLERARHARAIFVFMHEGAFSSGLHGDNDLAKNQYAPVLERAGVTLAVGGHDHHYERGRVGKLDYLVSGGGGAELRTQRCGVPGKKPCPPRVGAFVNDHHYIVVEVLPGLMRMCPKRRDGSPIEPCITKALPKR